MAVSPLPLFSLATYLPHRSSPHFFPLHSPFPLSSPYHHPRGQSEFLSPMARFSTRSRSLFILLCLALCVCDRVGAHQLRSNDLVKRQGIFGGLDDTTTGGGTTATGTTNTATSTHTTNTQPTNTGTTSTQPTNTNQNTATTTQTTPTSTTTNGQQTQTTDETSKTEQQNTSTQKPPEETSSVISTTDANGSVVMTTVFVSAPDQTGSATSSSASESSTSDDSSDSGLGTGSIIGMSVAGGVAVIGVVAFFIWKFTRKRYSDYDDGTYILSCEQAVCGVISPYTFPPSRTDQMAGIECTQQR